MTTNDILPDVLIPNLKLVICGSAVSTQSSHAGSYYAGQGNKFWQILCDTRLTDRVLHTVNANVILHNSGEENMHDSGEKSLWVSFK